MHFSSIPPYFNFSFVSQALGMDRNANSYFPSKSNKCEYIYPNLYNMSWYRRLGTCLRIKILWSVYQDVTLQALVKWIQFRNSKFKGMLKRVNIRSQAWRGERLNRLIDVVLILSYCTKTDNAAINLYKILFLKCFRK